MGRQLRADGHHCERCCHEPVDAVLGPLDDSENLGLYRLTSGTSGRSAGDASGGPEAQNHFNCKPPSIADVDEAAPFLPAGLAQLFEHVGMVLRSHSMVKKRTTVCAKHWISKSPDGVTISAAAV
jgi:hypothetical protein